MPELFMFSIAEMGGDEEHIKIKSLTLKFLVTCHESISNLHEFAVLTKIQH